MVAEDYFNVWISQYGVYDNYFIYETYEGDNYVDYKVDYTKAEDDTITITFDSKEKVDYKGIYVPVSDYELSINAVKELEKANKKIGELEKSLNEKEAEKSNNEKKTKDFNDLTNKLIALNSQVESMKPIVDRYNKDVFEKALNEATEDYKGKFKGVNALEIFEEESTKNLIKDSLSSDEKVSTNAIFGLNKLIVDNVKPISEIVDSDNIMDEFPRVSINSIQKLEDNKDLITNGAEDVYADKYGIDYK